MNLFVINTGITRTANWSVAGFVVALVGFGTPDWVCGQLQPSSNEAAINWNSTATSGEPWNSTNDPNTVNDPYVRPADFRSSFDASFKAPEFDAITASNRPVSNSAASLPGPSIEINLDAPESSLGNSQGMVAGFQELLGNQFGSVNWTRMLGSLGIVVVGYLVLVWMFRLFSPKGNGRLPSSVFELVGSARLNNRQSLQLVRIGGRLLMLIVSPEGAQPVGEISHPGEVEALVAQCNAKFGKKQTGKSYPTRPDQNSRPMGAALEQLVAALQQSTGNATSKHEFEA